MGAAGLVRGAYHFGRPGSDPVAQAKHFYSTVKPASADLPLALDIEVTDRQSDSAVLAWVGKFVAALKALDKRTPIIYTGGLWKYDLGNPGQDFGCPLWLAEYGPTAHVPRAWLGDGWTFWQYSSSGKVPGIKGNVDVNYFDGSVTDLHALCGGQAKSPLVVRLMKAGYGEISANQIVQALRDWDGLTVGQPLSTDSATFKRLVDAGFGPDSARQIIYALRFEAQRNN
jgi:hypothetical protein